MTTPRYRVLTLDDLSPGKLAKAVETTLRHLSAGDFRAADVKKLAETEYYRAKLDDTNRLLFRFARHGDEAVILVVEIVLNHTYDRSRFLRGVAIADPAAGKVVELAPRVEELPDGASLRYLHPTSRRFHLLDKPISFDDAQEQLYSTPLPLIIVGSAGSGKTALTLEKLRHLPGVGLYLTRSSFLIENARTLYRSNDYENDGQEVDFLSMQELLESVAIPAGRPATATDFAAWYRRQRGHKGLEGTDAHQVFEEIKGVLTGATSDAPTLSLSEYAALGVKQAIFLPEQREAVHRVFQRWMEHMASAGLHDPNIAAYERIALTSARYDFLVVDEVQDLTIVELRLALAHLRDKSAFLLCGDANQIVHPNLFSWARVKSLFHSGLGERSSALDKIHVLTANFRNTIAVTAIANRLLEIKQLRFGSVDRESNHLVDGVSQDPGAVDLLEDSVAVQRDLNAKIRRSTKAAVIVLRDEDKAEARATFSTPLVFSVHEAKGLEYETVVLWNVISVADREFRACCAGVDATDLRGELGYARSSDKTDKSLDAYKFYVNALYVAITRAMTTLVIVERNTEHPLFGLLAVERSTEPAHLAKVESSAEDWQREARRLELQGKLEQAEQIRRDVLGIRPVPWPITDVPAVGQLALDAFLGDLPGRFLGLDGALGTKAVCQRAFEIAITCRLPQWITRLRVGGFKHAKRAEAGRQFIEQTHYLEFGFRRSPTLFRQIAAHGVDFRNPLNETPLMVAARLGRGELAREFLELGADPDALDNLGRSALQIALEQWSDNALRPAALLVMHGVLAGSSMRLVIDGRMTKLEPSSGEWLLWQVCLMHYRKELAKFAGGDRILRDRTLQGMLPSFSAVDLARIFEELPRDLVPEHRRARTYISALLSKNEHHAETPRSKRLFVRLRQGQYALNPHVSLQGRAGSATLADLIGLPLWSAVRRPDSQPLDDLLDTTWQVSVRFARSRRKPSASPRA